MPPVTGQARLPQHFGPRRLPYAIGYQCLAHAVTYEGGARRAFNFPLAAALLNQHERKQQPNENGNYFHLSLIGNAEYRLHAGFQMFGNVTMHHP